MSNYAVFFDEMMQDAEVKKEYAPLRAESGFQLVRDMIKPITAINTA